jgi:GH15 family glucan-1,4-alpha-glucosidase
VDGKFSWVGKDWTVTLDYISDTLVTNVNLYSADLGLILSCNDAVDFHENVFIKSITVENLAGSKREVRLFFSNDFSIYGNNVGDTGALDPETGGIVHYKAARYFLANGMTQNTPGISSFAVGRKGVGALEGTYRDAEDGILSRNPIAQGAVDSVISLSLDIEGSSSAKAYYWLAAGQTWKDVSAIDAVVREKHPEKMITRTSDYWRLWIHKQNPRLELLPERVSKLYLRSLLILRTQIDWAGGIVAANDSDVIRFNRDTYSYVWPRDGALVANALDQAGYSTLAQNFYVFVAELIEQGGYLLHKYNPDGTLASSWHPWMDNGQPQLPIQEDETALIIWALWHHFVQHRDVEFIKPLYKSFIKRAADFMCEYRDKETGLPAPSYDLWEERRGILSFTAATVFAGITAASLFCTVFGETEIADRYQRVAAEIRDAASVHLWRDDLNRFCRMIYRNPTGEIEVDATRDSSLWGLFAFGLYAPHHPRIIASMADLRQSLWVKTSVGGMARYENDYYYSAGTEVPGNPWFVCTLWLADFMCETAKDEAELQQALEIMVWVADHALQSGVLAEQVHPFTGEPLSVSPLTWSHAAFVATTQRILKRLEKIKVCSQCGSVLSEAPREDWIAKLYAEACDSIYGMCRI